MKRKLKIGKNTLKFLQDLSENASENVYGSALYLAGADAKGVIRELVEVGTSEEIGCMCMTGAYPDGLTEGYVELVQKNLEPIAFVHVYEPFYAFSEDAHEYRHHIRERVWDGNCGDDPLRFKHMYFIRTCPDFTQVLRYNGKLGHRKHSIPLEEFDLQPVK